MEIMKIVYWIGENYENLFSSILVILGGLGVILEGLFRIIPGQESALTRLGIILTKAGKYVKMIMDLLKIPNKK